RGPAYGGGVGGAIPTAETIVLVSLLLELVGAGSVTASAMIIGELLVTVEKVDVGLRRQLGITANTCDPDEDLGRGKVKTDLRNRFLLGTRSVHLIDRRCLLPARLEPLPLRAQILRRLRQDFRALGG